MYTLIAEKGYDSSSIGQIATIVGIKKSSIYYYYKSKECIFIDLAKHLYKQNFQRPLKELPPATTSQHYRENLEQLGKMIISYYFENPSLRKVYAEIDVQTNRIPVLKEFVHSFDLEFKQFFIDYFQYGIEMKVFTPLFDVDEISQLLCTILVGIDHCILYNMPIDPEKVWQKTIDYIFREVSYD